MSDALRGNPIALRSCILYDFLLKKSADESYESLCSVVGGDVLPREEFDFWVNRFENRNFELEFGTGNLAKASLEVKLEKVEIETKPIVVEFSDLTTDVLKVVIEKSELKTQLILRKVSQGLRSLVDQVRPNVEKIGIFSNLDCNSLCFDNTEIHYAGLDFKKRPASIWEYHVIDEDYRKVCLDDLNVLFRNPKLKLDLLMVSSHLRPDDTNQNRSNFYGHVGRLLESIDHQCHVKSLHMSIPNQDDVLSVLQHLKPGVLNDAFLYRYSDGDTVLQLLTIDKLTKTEQWKRAEFVEIYGFKIQEPMESFYHLRHFEAKWNQVTPEMLTGLRGAIVKSTKFKDCEIYTNEIKDVERIMGQEKIDDDILMYPIPNSTEFLETTLYVDRIAIKKKARD